jgi:endonuclease/exonuclease/phosphatase family metal-dependent hydrolase
MATVRVATFNVENLFARYKFNSAVDPTKAVRDGWRADQRYFDIFDEADKKITAQTIKALNADILALQEVEGLDTLKRFRDLYLGGKKAYPFALALDGNDPRLIDVAVLSRYSIVHIRSHQFLSDSRGYPIFSRDCLEVDIAVAETKLLTLFINHFKSMMDRKHPCRGRSVTRPKRLRQAEAVKKIVIERFGKNAGAHPFVILGDFNDYLESDRQGRTALDSLVKWSEVENVVDRLDPKERWTHFWKGNPTCGTPPSYHQLDYILLSRRLAKGNAGLPVIERRGMPQRAARYSGPRFAGVGRDNPKASDHCPVLVEIRI